MEGQETEGAKSFLRGLIDPWWPEKNIRGGCLGSIMGNFPFALYEDK